MDFIKTPYISYMKDSAGNLYRGGWVQTDGPPLPFPHAWASSRYDPDGDAATIDIGEQRTESVDARGIPPLPKRVCRSCYIGDLDWIESGDFPSDAPPVVLAADGWPDQCEDGKMGVQSVGLAADPEFVVSGSPVTSRGVISLDWHTVPPGYALQGPASGPNAKPTFKPLTNNPPSPLPAALHLDGSTEYLHGPGAGFTTIAGDPWSFSVWFNNRTTATGIVFILWDTVSNAYLELVWSSGTLDLATSFFGGPADAITSAGTVGQIHLATGGYDPVNLVWWLQVDDGPRVTQPVSAGQPGINADTCVVGASTFALLPPFDFWPGDIEEFATYNAALSVEDVTNLYNNGDGLYYRQIPCVLWHKIKTYFPLWELSGNRLDLVQGLALVPVNNPGVVGPICGWRYGNPVEAASIVGSFSPGVTLLPQGSPPPTPPTGNVTIYQIGGNLQYIDDGGRSFGIIVSGTLAGFPQWIRYRLDWADLQTMGTVAVVTINFFTLPAGGMIHGFKINTTLGWSSSYPSTSFQLALGFDGGEFFPFTSAAAYFSGGNINNIGFNNGNAPVTSQGADILNCQNQDGQWILTITFRCNFGTVDLLTSGHTDIWVLVSTAPG